MQLKRLVWKIFITIVSCFLLLHFLKDSTQDIFGIKSPLDFIGNIQEDTSKLPEWLLWIYHWAWVNATLAQPAVVILTLKSLRKSDFSKHDLVIFLLICCFIFMMLWALRLERI